MNRSLDENIISEEERRDANKYFKRFLFPYQREAERKRIRGNLTLATMMGINLGIVKGVKDIETNKEIVPSKLTSKDLEEVSVYRTEGEKRGILVGEGRYNLTRKIISATVRPESDPEMRKKILNLENSLEDNIMYIASKASLEELEQLNRYLEDIIDSKDGDWYA